MPLRAQYLADIKLRANPYPKNPGTRIAEIYGTARKGRINLTFAMRIWTHHLSLLHAQTVAGMLPVIQKDYDDLIVGVALKLEATLSAGGKGGFGIAQKIVNLFMKDLWAFGVIAMPTEILLHAPIDRGVLGRFKKVPPPWAAWTRVVAGTRASATIKDYLSLQDQLRNLWSPSPIPFPSLIQMDQFLWHQIP